MYILHIKARWSNLPFYIKYSFNSESTSSVCFIWPIGINFPHSTLEGRVFFVVSTGVSGWFHVGDLCHLVLVHAHVYGDIDVQCIFKITTDSIPEQYYNTDLVTYPNMI